MEQRYLLNAIDAALLAGEQILAVYNDPASDFEIERKADNSPLTIADKKAHVAIVEKLKQTPFPVLSEEGKHLPYSERKKWEALWIVDPLDGTKEFIKRNGEFTVNIAWVFHSVPVGGVIYVPVKRTLYWAEETMGAYKLSNIVARGGKSLEELNAMAIRLPDVAAAHVRLQSSGSSIKICLVAEGVADVYPRFAPTMEWDTAAGHAIARASGKEIYQAGQNSPLSYNKEDLHNPWFIVENKHKIETDI